MRTRCYYDAQGTFACAKLTEGFESNQISLHEYYDAFSDVHSEGALGFTPNYAKAHAETNMTWEEWKAQHWKPQGIKVENIKANIPKI